MQVYVKLVNHGVHGVKLMIYQLAHCVNSCGLCVKMTVNVYKMLRVKGPLVYYGKILEVFCKILIFLA